MPEIQPNTDPASSLGKVTAALKLPLWGGRSYGSSANGC